MKKKIKRKMWADYDIFLILTKQLEKQEKDLGVKTKWQNDKERGEEAFAMTDN